MPTQALDGAGHVLEGSQLLEVVGIVGREGRGHPDALLGACPVMTKA